MRKFLTILTILVLCIWAYVYATTFSYTYDTSTPAGSDDPAEADDRMREIKAAVQERMNVDHAWQLTGSAVSDANIGEHRQITFCEPNTTPSAVAANKGILYTKDVNDIAELHYINESEQDLQLSSLGNNLANDTYLTASDTAGTGSVDIVKVDVNDTIIIGDGAELAAGTQTTDPNRTIADKGYVIDQIAATIGDGNFAPLDYTNDGGGDSRESITFPNGLIFKHGIIANDTSPKIVTFDVAFTGVVSAMACFEGATASDQSLRVQLTITTLTITTNSGTATDNYYWQAWGY